MKFIFEDTDNFLNFTSCKDVNPSTIRRFGTSSLVMKIIKKNNGLVVSAFQNHENYIISASVNHSPNDWAKKDGFLKYLTPRQLSDLKNKKAMVLLDQTLEGYQTNWLWDYFHNECSAYEVDPRSIIYITGNMLAEEQYDTWASNSKILSKISVISHPIFENDVFEIFQETIKERSFDYWLDYKKNNLKNIKDYNCLQKRLRAHRIWFYNHLYKEKLLSYGLVSMNPYNYKSSYMEGKWLPFEASEEANKILPLLIYGKNNNEKDDNYYIRRITDQVFKDTWVSVISEASFADSDHTLFLSEKIFKPIACMHPFIIVGNKNSLKKLKEMGYKTFEGFIDEDYDSLSTFDRFDAITKSIKKIIDTPNKIDWYYSMKEILVHNYNTLKTNSLKISPGEERLNIIYKEYFNYE